MWVVDVVVGGVVGIDDDGVGRPFCPKGASGIYEQKISDWIEVVGESKKGRFKLGTEKNGHEISSDWGSEIKVRSGIDGRGKGKKKALPFSNEEKERKNA